MATLDSSTALNVPITSASGKAGFALNNVLPLSATAGSSSGSKPVYTTSMSSNSTVAVSSASSTEERGRKSAPPCTSMSQPILDSDSSSLQQQHPVPANMPGRGIWNRTAQLARLVSFPVRATRAYYSYVPLGQQLYLNPQTVATSLDPLAQAASPQPLAGATAVELACENPATTIVPSEAPHQATKSPSATAVGRAPAVVDNTDSVVQQRREQLGRLWMHRMPTYRARFQQICIKLSV